MVCRLCDSENLILFYKQGSQDQFHYYRCKNCGLANLDLDSVSIIKNQEKYAINPMMPDKRYMKQAQVSFRFIKKYLAVRGEYLDIGCGYGSLLYYMNKDGWKVKGLELSKKLSKHVYETYNIEVVVKNFLDFDTNEKYLLVSLRHVIEHLPDSRKAMQKIGDMLLPGGYLHLEFPNNKGLAQRIKRFRNKFPLIKKKYNADYVPGHCNEFSLSSFKYLIKLSGFRLIRIETYSTHPISNFFYNHIHIGTRYRVILQKEANSDKS